MTARSGGRDEAVAARRVLVGGGIGLCLVGMLFGEIYAIFHLHQSAFSIEASLVAATRAVAAGDPAALAGPMEAIGRASESMATKRSAHAHWTQLGFLALVLGLLEPGVGSGGRRRTRRAWTLVLASFLMPLGVFAEPYVGTRGSPLEAMGWPRIVSMAAGAAIALVVAVELVGVVRRRRAAAAEAAPESAEPARTTLVRGGAFLVAAGLLHGGLYGAFGLGAHAERDDALLRRILDEAAGGRLAAAEEAVGAYGGLQAEKAIFVATHTHLVELGFLALLLSTVQRFVFVQHRWKRRWARGLVAGGVLLPAAVQAELAFGLAAGAVADLGGLLVVVALAAMLVGVVRYTGAVDAERVGRGER